MAALQPLYSKEEFAQRGDKIYERDIRPHAAAEDTGKFVLIDIETGAYEMDVDELAASDRLLARCPNAQIWMTRVGSRAARHFGPHRKFVTFTKEASFGMANYAGFLLTLRIPLH